MRHDFKKLITAIRKIENGGEGRQFGILNKKADTFRRQAGWCAATCWKNWVRWQRTNQETPYLLFLADKYAPLGAENDPTGLNANWLPNLMTALEQ